MKHFLFIFLAYAGLSFGNDSTPVTPASLFPYTAEQVVSFGSGWLIGASTNSSTQAGLFCANIALQAALAHVECWAQFKKHKEEVQKNPFPDSPEKRKLAEDLKKEGYEVYFIKSPKPAIFSYGKKIVLSLPSDDFSNLNNPRYKAWILAHTDNNYFLKKRSFYNLLSGTLGCAAMALFRKKLYPLVESPLFSYDHLKCSAGSAALACGFYAAWLLAYGAFCQSQKKQIDTALAAALKDPLVLEEMARYYKEQPFTASKKTWRQWFGEKTSTHPTNASRALFFKKEAAKMRKRQLSIQ